MITIRSSAVLLCLFVLAGWSSGSDAKVFEISRLPKGKDITLLTPATTWVPMMTRVMLTATDSPQTVRFKTIAKRGQKYRDVKLAIFDANQDQVRYVDLKRNVPFLYNFKGLSSIFIIPQLKDRTSKGSAAVVLEVESNKPLSLAR